MVLSYLRSIQRRRTAARNHDILSALDDDALRDIGLERRTLRAFCDNGCTLATTPVAQPVGAFIIPLPQMLDIRSIRSTRAATDDGLAAAAP